MTERGIRRLRWAGFSLLIVVALAARLIPGARTIDDAFITFRYARNIVEGQGFVYNPGVATLGTTTPLFTLMLSAASAISGSRDFPQIAILFSAAADAITVVLLALITRRALVGRQDGALKSTAGGRPDHPFPERRPYEDLVAFLPGLLWAVSPMSVTFAVGGMETSINILWMVAAVAAYVTRPAYGNSARWRNDAAVGAFVGLGLLTRADAVLWAGPLLGWQFLEGLLGRAKTGRGSLPITTWIALSIVLLPWALYATATFGSPIPNSVTAKRYAYLIPDGSALIRMIQTYSTPFFEFDTFGSVGAMVASLVYLLLSLMALSLTARRLPQLIPWLLYPWLYLTVFAVLNPLIFRWYMAPPLPALMVGIVVGLWGLVGALRPRAVSAMVMTAAGMLWLFMSINGWTLYPDHGPDRPAPRMAFHALELEYEAMAGYLREELGVTPETRVASGDIGAVGYFSRATIVDTVGLVTPELTRYYPVDPAIVAADQNYGIPPALIADTEPEYLVTMEGFVREGLVREPWFAAAYRLIREQPFPFYGTAMQLYQRQSEAVDGSGEELG